MISPLSHHQLSSGSKVELPEMLDSTKAEIDISLANHINNRLRYHLIFMYV